MLQISQTEKPICSATIDQIRLRRAMNLPLAFQNFSSSGFQSEIQVAVGSLIGDFPWVRMIATSSPARPRGQKKPQPDRGAHLRSSQTAALHVGPSLDPTALLMDRGA